MWSILGFTRSITKNESQLIASALRANYSKMFSGMIRKFSMLSLPFCVTIKVPVPSVADPGCLSRIPDPDFYPSRIPDPGSRIPDPKTATKDRGEKNSFVKPFFVATNFTKLNIILFLICWRKKFGPIFQELLKFLPKKLSPSPQKYGFGIRDPRSGIRKKPIPDPGSRGQKGTGSRIRIRNTTANTIKSS